MRVLVSLLSIFGACSAAADPLALSLLDAERHLGVHARHAALRSAEPDTAERLDAQLKLLELHVADSKLPTSQRQKAEGVLRLLQAVRAEPRTLEGQPELPHLTVAVGEAGRSCAQALPLDQGDARRVPIGAGESLWFRVQLPDAVNLGLSTRGSSVDAALSVHADCRTLDQPAVASADDNYGLQAELVVPARQSFWMVRYDNLSPVGGEAVLRATTSGILQGTVRTREGELLPGPQPLIEIYRRESNSWVFSRSATVTNGSFSTPISQPGSYAARTVRAFNSPFIDQAFNNIPCVGSGLSLVDCNNGNVTEILINGTETRTIDFRLDRGVPVVGVVSDQSGQPLVGALVELRMDAGGGSSTITDANGRYRLDGNPAGVARLRASATQYRSVMHSNILCDINCTFPQGGTPLPLTLGNTAVVDFRLPPAPSLTVNVSILNDQLSNFNTSIELALLRPNGSLIFASFVSSFSPSVNFGAIGPGEYILRLRSPATIPRLYPDLECEDDCIPELGQAERVIIPDLPITTTIDFRTRRYPMIFGTVRDAQTGLPINGQSFNSLIELLRLGAGTPQSSNFQGNGAYFLRAIPPGSYILRARAPTYVSSVYSGFSCETALSECADFTPVLLTRTSQDRQIDFLLTPLGRASVTVRNPTDTSQSLAVLTPTGTITTELLFGVSSGTGTLVNGIPLGSRIFGLRATNAVPQLYEGIDCPLASPSSFSGCPFAQATPLFIQSNQTQTIAFSQRQQRSRRVVVRTADTSAPLPSVILDLWNSSGVRVRSFTTDANGIAWIGGTSGSSTNNFALSTDNRQGYLDQVHAGINCPNGSAFAGLCSLSGATPISLPAPDNNQPTIEILLQRETPLFRNGFEAAN